MPCQNKGYKEIALKYDSQGQPFAVAFAYPEDGPCIIKGSESDVLKYIKENLGFCHYNFTLWNKKQVFLEEWRFTNKNWEIIETFVNGKKKYSFNYKGKSVLKFRTVPKKFIKEIVEYSKTRTRKK